MPGSQEKAEENGHTLMKKVEEDEVIEDEFNIHSTVGLVSALLLSCLASTVSDSKDLKDFAEERDRRWELQDEGVSIFDVYQAMIFVSMSCNSVLTTVNFATASVTSDHASLCMFVKHRIRGNVLAIMTAIARLIAFQRVAKSDAPEFQRIMGEGRVGWCTGALPVVAMAAGVISYILVMLVQGYLVMHMKTFWFCVATITVCIIFWTSHEVWIIRAKRAVNHPELLKLTYTCECEDAAQDRVPVLSKTLRASVVSIRSGWMAVGVVFISGFSLMGFTGKIIYDNAPPIPTFRLEGDHGAVLWTSEDVLEGQQMLAFSIWQSIGGQQMGSVWGHGALQAPGYATLGAQKLKPLQIGQRTGYIGRQTSGCGSVSYQFNEDQVLRRLTRFYVALFTGASESPEVEDLPKLRKLFQVKDVALYSEEKAEKLAGFVFWSAWACVTERPGESHTYTNNWPQERLVGNTVSPEVG
ncbi:norB, partial [Symbiodinium microadriaticum]